MQVETRYRLQMEITEASVPEHAVGLLVPVPPTTPHQKLIALGLDPTWRTLRVRAESGAQSAIFATVNDHDLTSPIGMTMIVHGFLDEAHFAIAKRGNADEEADALELAAELGLPASSGEIERLDKIVTALARKFHYQSGYVNDAPVTCDMLTGNCLSINKAFLKMTTVANIRSAYYIGYFFESTAPLTTKDWHCWVGTLTQRGVESWDIAHHLKRGLKRIRPGLNPVPGFRFAMSVGRDLVFRLPTAAVRVPHLCEPRWIFKDGSSRGCEVMVSATAIHVLESATA